jgi:hypothetical protein
MTETKKSPGETLVQERLAERQKALEEERARQKAARDRRETVAGEERGGPPEPIGVDLETVVLEAKAAWERGQLARAQSLGITLEDLEARQEAERHAIDRADNLEGAGTDLEAEDLEAIITGRLREEEPLDIVRRWLAASGIRPILVLCGAVGVGKTLAAAVAIAELGGKMVHAPDLGRRVFPYSHEKDVDRLALTTGMMVLDDLGTEADHREKRWSEAFALFVEKRKGRGRTIITSNLTPKEIRERYDARILDRLNARAYVVVLKSRKSLRAGGGGL